MRKLWTKEFYNFHGVTQFKCLDHWAVQIEFGEPTNRQESKNWLQCNEWNRRKSRTKHANNPNSKNVIFLSVSKRVKTMAASPLSAVLWLPSLYTELTKRNKQFHSRFASNFSSVKVKTLFHFKLNHPFFGELLRFNIEIAPHGNGIRCGCERRQEG